MLSSAVFFALPPHRLRVALRHHFFARCYDTATWPAERIYFDGHRRALTIDLTGPVLEIGTGTGAMMPYFAAERSSGNEFELWAIEPDPYMRARAHQRVEQENLAVHLIGARAESLPFPADYFSCVIASMVFCTITDPGRVLEEVRRILRPGGELRLFEHVAAHGWSHRFQRLISPIWQRLAGGCRPTRRTDQRILSHPAFEPISVTTYPIIAPPIRPFVRGRFRLVETRPED